MNKVKRALIELQNWVDANGQGFSINYAAHNPTYIDGIPHHWSVQAGRTDREHYIGYGMTMDTAILDCYARWEQQSRD